MCVDIMQVRDVGVSTGVTRAGVKRARDSSGREARAAL